jgi:beta-1,4-mannosyltransferase
VHISGLANRATTEESDVAQESMPAQDRRAFKPAIRPQVSVWPIEDPGNRFISMFSRAISEQGYSVRPFRWGSLGLRRTDFALFHWPDEFFAAKGRFGPARPLIKLGIIYTAKILWGTRFIWIAHNGMPHEAVRRTPLIQRWFLRSLAGVVYLSHYSRVLINDMYPELRNCETLVTVHGHYRDTSATPATPATSPASEIKLINFGQIRRYKNVEQLVDVAVSIPSGIRLKVAGVAADRSLCASIEEKARVAPHITLDFREAPIGEAELEGMIDSADAVVMPYRNILNSGSALFALSRNRPVLAPNMGSLPELREHVGRDWVYLYDGEFTRHVLVDFREWVLRTRRSRVAPLDAYDFSRVGQDLSRLIERMSH